MDPKFVLKQCNCIRIYLEVRELFFSLFLLLFIVLFYFFHIKRANSLFMLSDFHSQPATAVLTFIRVKYHFHVNYTTFMNTIGSTYEPFFHRNQPLDFY